MPFGVLKRQLQRRAEAPLPHSKLPLARVRKRGEPQGGGQIFLRVAPTPARSTSSLRLR
jgi:hypothetical protein